MRQTEALEWSKNFPGWVSGIIGAILATEETLPSRIDLHLNEEKTGVVMKSVPTGEIRRKSLGGVIAFVGFLLSPLSWWNDLVVNVPLALAFAWCVGLVYPPGFGTSFVVGYWLTNVIGLILMHWGAGTLISKFPKRYGRAQIIRDSLIALFYTALIVALVKLKILVPLPQSVFKR